MDARNELKGQSGLVRLLNATRYSLAGYKAAWQDEEAFRQICLLAVIGLPLACWLGRDWAESVLLAVPLVFCLLVELLNSAIENVVDRISLEWHPLAKKAKELNLDAIHDTVHEMAKDEARHGRGFEGLLKRYFNTEV